MSDLATRPTLLGLGLADWMWKNGSSLTAAARAGRTGTLAAARLWCLISKNALSDTHFATCCLLKL